MGVVPLSYAPPQAISYFNLTLEGNWLVSDMRQGRASIPFG